MKKSVLIVAFVFLFLAIFPLISASTNSTVADNGFSCLQNKTQGQCSDLSTGQQIFTSLATGLCTDYVKNSSLSEGCWSPSSGTVCDIQTTAEAMLALNNRGVSINNSKSWLISQNHTTSSLINWYLQIDSNKATTCTITYPDKSTTTIDIGADKKIQQNSAGNCFSRSSNGYWLQVQNPSSCFGKEFKISCNESFTATKLYQQSPASTYPTVYVSSSSQTASSGAQLKESFGSYCFGSSGTTGTCNYKDTLWATMILNKLNYDITPYLPYLTIEAGNPVDGPYSQYLPYAFLYSLTSSPDYLAQFIDSQKLVNGQKYWQYSQDPYFGTSLALLSLGSSDSSDSQNAIDWLSNNQGSNGCWNNGDILDTAFVLYSAFGPRNLANQTPDSGSVSPQTCVGTGYCLSASVCTNQANGTSLGSDYSASCPAFQICCSKDYVAPTCAEQNGQFCSQGKVCNVSTISSSDSTSGQLCCPSSGFCVTASTTTTPTCTSLDGTCRNSCQSNEPTLSGTCTGGQVCCGTPGVSNSLQNSSNNTIWIILLSLLIVLAVLGIIFRKKLTEWWHKMKLHGKGKGSGSPAPGFGPRRPPFPPRGPPPFQRRPPFHPLQNQKKPAPRSSKEVDDVLKKLKEMGK